MGNYFPSIGHAEQYFAEYIKQPLRSLVSPNPAPAPPPQPPADPHSATTQRCGRADRQTAAANRSQPTAAADDTAGSIEMKEKQSAATERQRTVATADTAALQRATATEASRLHSQSRSLSQQQRATLAQLQTDAATHVGTQGLIDDMEGGDRQQHDRHVHLDTAPPDPRWAGHPDQSHYCWALYGSYLKCIDKRGVLDEHCLFLKKSAVAMCPVDLIEEWTADRKAGRWYGVPVPYHKGEMDLLELQEELEAAAAAAVRVAPLREDASVAPEDETRKPEADKLWEPQQAQREQQRRHQPSPQHVKDMKVIIQHAMGAIHK